MAWIKISHETPDKPEIAGLADILNIDHDAAFGKCMRLWIWADQQSVSGNDLSVTGSFIDRLTTCPGFSDALSKVGWLTARNGRVSLPNFDRHNGQTAKNRALTTNRVKRLRNAPSVTNSLPDQSKSKSKNKDQIQTRNSGSAGFSVFQVDPKNGTANGHPVAKPKKEFPPDSEPAIFAAFFSKFHQDWATGAKPPDGAKLQKWAAVFDSINRIDNREWSEIETLLNAIDQEKPSKGSDFLWRKVILSPEKFRIKWNEGKLNKFIPEAIHDR